MSFQNISTFYRQDESLRKIHTFQKYSQKENWVSNNTLLFLSRLQNYNNQKFERVINAILQEDNLILNIGVNFLQQERGSKSVLDGAVFKEEIKIGIETKLFDNFSTDQLKHHFKSDSAESGKNRISLTLSKSEVADEIKSQVISCIKKMNSEIKLASISFPGLLELVKENVAEYEVEFHEIIDEFREFCAENKLFKDETKYMLVLAADTSIKENLEFGTYYDPVQRSHNTDFQFIGLYCNKAIVAVGEAQHCVLADLFEGNLEIKSDGNVPERIKEMIIKTSYYDVHEGH